MSPFLIHSFSIYSQRSDCLLYPILITPSRSLEERGKSTDLLGEILWCFFKIHDEFLKRSVIWIIVNHLPKEKITLILWVVILLVKEYFHRKFHKPNISKFTNPGARTV